MAKPKKEKEFTSSDELLESLKNSKTGKLTPAQIRALKKVGGPEELGWESEDEEKDGEELLSEIDGMVMMIEHLLKKPKTDKQRLKSICADIRQDVQKLYNYV